MTLLYLKSSILHTVNPLRLDLPVDCIIKRSDDSYSLAKVTHSSYVMYINGCSTRLVTAHFKEHGEFLYKTVHYSRVEERESDFDYLVSNLIK